MQRKTLTCILVAERPSNFALGDEFDFQIKNPLTKNANNMMKSVWLVYIYFILSMSLTLK